MPIPPRSAAALRLLAFVALASATEVGAAVDLTGVYVSDTGARAGLTQSGTSLTGYYEFLSITGSVSEDGHFLLEGGPVRCSLTTTAQFYVGGVGDGYELVGNTGACGSSRPLFMTKCGNGLPDGEEICDDGNRSNGDCCSMTCTYDAAGTPCTADTNVCTDDTCDASGSCTHVANAIACDDGNECTTGDQCSASTCIGSAVADGLACTNDQNDCTNDVCSGGSCMHSPNSNLCDDGNACSTGDNCSTGTCKPTGVAPQCQGDFDASGTWYPDWNGSVVTIEQDGAALAYTNSVGVTFPGSINPATGSFRVTGAADSERHGDLAGIVNPQGTKYLARWVGEFPSGEPVNEWHTASRCPDLAEPCCGNGLVEAGEVCDDPFCCAADCQGSLSNAPCSDELVCRKSSRTTPASDLSAIPLQDRFGDWTVKLAPANGLCAPGSQMYEQPALRPAIHALSYRASALTGLGEEVALPVWDRFGIRDVVVKKLVTILMPAAAAVGDAGVDAIDAAERDVYACYAARPARGQGRIYAGGYYADTFGIVPAGSKAISRLCVPASLDGGDPAAVLNPGQLLCYKSRTPDKLDAFEVSVRDELSLPGVLHTSGLYDVCVPAIVVSENPPYLAPPGD